MSQIVRAKLPGPGRLVRAISVQLSAKAKRNDVSRMGATGRSARDGACESQTRKSPRPIDVEAASKGVARAMRCAASISVPSRSFHYLSIPRTAPSSGFPRGLEPGSIKPLQTPEGQYPRQDGFSHPPEIEGRRVPEHEGSDGCPSVSIAAFLFPRVRLLQKQGHPPFPEPQGEGARQKAQGKPQDDVVLPSAPEGVSRISGQGVAERDDGDHG